MSGLPPSSESSGSSPPPAQAADDRLPPVEPPSASFLLQLFLIPLVIVSIIVAVWAMFSWVVQLGSSPQDLVAGIRAMNDASWHKAYTLSDLLRNPEYDHLKDDARLAGELAELLTKEVQEGSLNSDHRNLRIYLSRALGEFRVPQVAPALVLAATSQRSDEEIAVRRTAIEGLAVLADNVGAERLREAEGVVDAVIKASYERGEGELQQAKADLRSSAAFTLGVLGGEAAVERLVVLLDDPYANVRYNAALGLARSGDTRAEPTLVEMLDPNDPRAVADEEVEGAKQQKRLQVLTSAIAAAAQLGYNNPDADLQSTRDALERLSRAEVPRAVRLEAREALLVLERR